MVGFKKKSHPLVTTEEETKAKDKKANKANKDKSPAAKLEGMSLTSWGVQPALLAFGLIALLSAALELLFVTALEDSHQGDFNVAMSSVVKRDLDFYAQERLSAIQSIVAQDQMLVALSDNQSEASGLLRATLPDLKALYIVPTVKLNLVRNLYPELGFASVDALRKASEKKAPQIETFFENNEWFYQIALEAKGAKEAFPATVLFVFTSAEISNLLKAQSKALSGQISLLSSGEENAVTVISHGDRAADNQVFHDLKFGTWRLRYSPSEQGIVVVDRKSMWAILALTAVLSIISIFVLCRIRLSRIQKDIGLSSTLIQSGINGSRKPTSRLAYYELIQMVQAVNSLLKIKEDEQLKTKKEAPKAPLASDAMTVQETGPSTSIDDDLDFDDLDLDDQLSMDDTAAVEETPLSDLAVHAMNVPQSIFRAYDIRGIVDDTLTESTVELIGRALASEALAQGQQTLCVGYDGRLSSVDYCNAICRGITSTGANAVIVGRVPTPVLYFATHELKTGTGVMITGSHNPANYNGFKMMVAGRTLSGDDIQRLYSRIVEGNFVSGEGAIQEHNVDQAYLDTILGDVAVAAPLKVVLDAGNGVAGELAPKLVEELGCEVIPLFCDIDGTFPNHHPDPGKPANLQDLIAAVKANDADIGLAFDGDGDRLGVVTNTGKIIWPDRLLMLFAKDVVARNPGADIIYDVKCSRRLNGLISEYGGRPIMWKTGHSLIKAKMKETGALLAGEMSGHIFFKERWFGFDDGLYSAVRLLEILGVEDRSAEEVFADFPEDVSTPEINIEVTDESKFTIVEKLCMLKDSFLEANVSTIDGLRVDFANGWGLCRASNTTPMLVLRFEADDEESLESIKQQFKKQLLAVDSSLNVDF